MSLSEENKRLSQRLALVAIGMFGFAFALVPFYDQIHAALEEGSLVEKSALASNTHIDASRSVTIEFDSNAYNLPWRFRPLVGSLKVHPGERADTIALSYTFFEVPGRGGKS